MNERKQDQDPTVKDEPGSQPKKYYKGLSKDDKEKRADHFKKGSKKPAPGDKDAKTTPSKHTKKFNKDHDSAINILDPLLNINWPIEITEVSERDRSHNMLNKLFKG